MRPARLVTPGMRAILLLIVILASATPAARVSAQPADAVSSWLRQNATTDERADRVLRRPHVSKSTVQHAAVVDAKSGSPSLFWLLPLLAVLAVIFIATMVARRWLPGVRQMTGGGVIHILTRRYLSSKQSLCLVRLGQRVVLLGVTPERITALANIDDSQEVASMVAAVESARPGSFSRTMSALAPNESDAAPPPGREAWSISTSQFSEAAQAVRGILARVRQAAKSGAAPT